MNAATSQPVILGIGNILLRDDAVGVRVVEAVRRLVALDPGVLPAGTRLIDGGTLGPDVLAAVSGARSLLIVDAVDLGEAPGTLVVLRDDGIAAAGSHASRASSGGVVDMLALGRLMGWVTGPVAMVGVQVAEVGFDLGLSPAVEAALPAAVELACRSIRTLDAEARRDPRGAASPAAPGGVS
jgi:hydrogenase maturation protease